MTMNKGHFHLVFWAFDSCFRSFIQYIHPIIGINVANLSKNYLAVLMIATTIDRFNKLFLITFGVAKIEGRE